MSVHLNGYLIFKPLLLQFISNLLGISPTCPPHKLNKITFQLHDVARLKNNEIKAGGPGRERVDSHNNEIKVKMYRHVSDPGIKRSDARDPG